MRNFLAATTLALVLTPCVHADQLADVKARGTLTCGVFSGVEPFAFQDTATRELKGYDVDVCKAIAGKLGLKPEVKVVSLEARIPELLQGRVDVLAAVLGYNPARAEQIVFSNTYFVSRQMLSAKTGAYTKRDDLNGKRISTVKGSSNVPLLLKALPTASPMGYDDVPTAFMALVQGKVEGFVASEVPLLRLMSKLGDQSKQLTLLEPPVATEYWGIGLRKGEPAMEKAVNDSLLALEKSGELDKIFSQWMGAGTEYDMKRPFTVGPIPR